MLFTPVRARTRGNGHFFRLLSKLRWRHFITGFECSTKLADASITYGHRNLKYRLLRGAQKLCRPGYAAFQKILMNRSAVKLTETGF